MSKKNPTFGNLYDEKIIMHFEKLLSGVTPAMQAEKWEQAYEICMRFLDEFYELALDKDLIYKSFDNHLEWATALVEWLDTGWPIILSEPADLHWLPIPVAEAYFLMGFIMHETKRYDEAMLFLNTAIYWNPLSAKYYNELASVFAKDLSNMSLALEYYKKALENA